jgi:hypothetical protein
MIKSLSLIRKNQLNGVTDAELVGNAELGRRLVELVLDRSAGRLPAEPQERLLAPQVMTTVVV